MRKLPHVIWDSKDPLVLIESEPRKANAALRAYYELGPGRTTSILTDRYREMSGEAGYVPPSTSYGTVRNWCHVWDWVKRVQDQEDIDAAQRVNLWDAASMERQKVWEDRRADICETSYQSAKLLRDAASHMLEYLAKWEIGESIKETKNELGGTDRVITRTIRPKVSLSQLANALVASDQLLRTVVGLPQTSPLARQPRSQQPTTLVDKQLNVLVVNVE